MLLLRCVWTSQQRLVYIKGAKGNWLEQAKTEEKSLECKPCRDRQPFLTLGTLVVLLDEQSQSEARGEALGRPSSFAVPSSGRNATQKEIMFFCQSSRKVTVPPTCWHVCNRISHDPHACASDGATWMKNCMQQQQKGELCAATQKVNDAREGSRSGHRRPADASTQAR